MMFVNQGEGLCDPQPQSAQLAMMARLLVSADLTADEIPARNKQCPHEADLRRLRLRTVTTLAQVWGRGAPSVTLIGSVLCEWKL